MDESVVSTTTAPGEDMTSIGEAVSSSTAVGTSADATVEELMQMSHDPPTSINSHVDDTSGNPVVKTDSNGKPVGASDINIPMSPEDYMQPNSPSEMDTPNYPVRINMDKIRRIQSSLPVDDPLAPLGSTKNPIRIIQQGNQFITTQNLSDDQLKQILQVLKNQPLVEDNGETRITQTNSIYNPDTSTKIIFRVTNATRALARAQEEEGTLIDYRHRPRKRPKYGDTDSSDPDFDPGVPDEELGPIQPRRKNRAGRSVKPPKHLVKDYKHIRVTELNNDFREEESDGGYSDYDTKSQGKNDENDADWYPSDEEDAQANMELPQEPQWPCPLCGQRFQSKGGVSRHQFMKHGVSVRGNLKTKPAGLMGRKPREAMLIPVKRRNKLKQAIASATDEDLIELVLPRLAKLISPWDYLLSRSEQGDPPFPVTTQVLADYMNLHEIFRDFISEHLVQGGPVDVPVDETEEPPIYVKIDNDDHAKLLHLPIGDYRVKSRLNEGYLPSQYKGVQTMIDIQRERQRKQREEDAAREAWLFSQQKQQTRDEGILGLDNPESIGATLLITDEDMTSGRYLAVLNEDGEPTDLVLNASSGVLYHRPTGQQVILLDDGTAATVVPADEVSAAALESGAVSMESLAYENGIAIEGTETSKPVVTVDNEENRVDEQPVVDVMNEHTVSISEPQPPSMSLDTDANILDNQEPSFDEESLAQPLNQPEENHAEMMQDEVKKSTEESSLKPETENVGVEEHVEEAVEQHVEEEEEEVQMEEEEEEVIESPIRRHKTRTGRKSAALKFENTEDHTITQRTAPPLDDDDEMEVINENTTEGVTPSNAVDVSQLFPGVTVTDIDENTMLIDAGDGRKIQVDHGGLGITLETFQSLLAFP